MTVVSGTCQQILALLARCPNNINENNPLAALATFVRSNNNMLTDIY